MPACAGDGRRGGAVVAGEHRPPSSPQPRRAATAAGASGLSTSATAISPSARPAKRHVDDASCPSAASASARGSQRGDVDAARVHQRAVAEQDAARRAPSRRRPVPGTVANSPTGGSARPRVLGAGHDRLADADARSPARRPPPARAARPPRRPADRDDVGDARAGRRVSVPVLSNTTVSTRCSRSSAAALRISTPCSAPRPVATMMAVGVASPIAHGQAMTSTATALVSACSERRLRTEQPPAGERQRGDARARPARTPRPRGRPGAGWAPASPAPPRRAG